MRARYLIAAVIQAGAFAVTCAAPAQETTQPQRVHLSNLQFFAMVRDMKSDTDALLGDAARRALPAQSAGPSVDLGRLHASLGGVTGRHVQLGSYRLDTSEFLNSSISGSVDGRGARMMFTVPLQ